MGVHPARAEHLAVPDLRREPRPAPPDLHRLHQTRRQRQRARQQGDAPADGRAACRAGEAAGLLPSRPLRARRADGQERRAGLRPAEPALAARAGDGEEGGRRPPGADPPGRARLQAPALGLVVLHGEDPKGPLQPGRERIACVLHAGERAPGGLPGGRAALRAAIRRADRPADVPSGGPHVRGERRRRLASGRLLRRFPPATGQAGRRMGQRVPAAARPRRAGHPPARHQRLQLHPAGGRHPRPAQAHRGRDALPRVRPRAALAALADSLPQPGLGPAGFRRAALADHGALGRSPRCSGCTRGTGRRASRSPTI
jgi:hypothetical protein